jgi:hypothetical protein
MKNCRCKSINTLLTTGCDGLLKFPPSPDYVGEKQLHVAVVLPIVLPAKPLTIKDVADVADFPDLHANAGFQRSRLIDVSPSLTIT